MTIAEQFEKETGLKSGHYLADLQAIIYTQSYVKWLHDKVAKNQGISSDRIDIMRFDAKTVLELNDNYSPELKDMFRGIIEDSNRMAGYVLELTSQ